MIRTESRGYDYFIGEAEEKSIFNNGKGPVSLQRIQIIIWIS